MNEEQTTVPVTYFNAGDDVPEWILRRDVRGEDGSPGTFRFGTDVAVLCIGGKLWVIPIDPLATEPHVGLKDAECVEVWAFERDVVLGGMKMVFHAPHVGGEDDRRVRVC